MANSDSLGWLNSHETLLVSVVGLISNCIKLLSIILKDDIYNKGINYISFIISEKENGGISEKTEIQPEGTSLWDACMAIRIQGKSEIELDATSDR